MFKRSKARINAAAAYYAQVGYSKPRIFLWKIMAWAMSIIGYLSGYIFGFFRGFFKAFKESHSKRA